MDYLSELVFLLKVVRVRLSRNAGGEFSLYHDPGRKALLLIDHSEPDDVVYLTLRKPVQLLIRVNAENFEEFMKGEVISDKSCEILLSITRWG